MGFSHLFVDTVNNKVGIIIQPHRFSRGVLLLMLRLRRRVWKLKNVCFHC